MDGYHSRAYAIMLESHSYLCLLTGYGQPEDIQHTRTAGFDAHLIKAVHLDVLDKSWRSDNRWHAAHTDNCPGGAPNDATSVFRPRCRLLRKTTIRAIVDRSAPRRYNTASSAQTQLVPLASGLPATRHRSVRRRLGRAVETLVVVIGPAGHIVSAGAIGYHCRPYFASRTSIYRFINAHRSLPCGVLDISACPNPVRAPIRIELSSSRICRRADLIAVHVR